MPNGCGTFGLHPHPAVQGPAAGAVRPHLHAQDAIDLPYRLPKTSRTFQKSSSPEPERPDRHYFCPSYRLPLWEDRPCILPDRVPIGPNMRTSRTCGECSLCCKLLPIAVLDKQANLWCQHCKPGNGCSIYNIRPQVCTDYHCGWLLGVLNDNWYPAN